MKGLIDSCFYKISNLLGRNEQFYDTNNEVVEPDEDLIHMSYNDYIKFINAEENKKATPLQPDAYE
jgi:hypothetical protein